MTQLFRKQELLTRDFHLTASSLLQSDQRDGGESTWATLERVIASVIVILSSAVVETVALIDTPVTVKRI